MAMSWSTLGLNRGRLTVFSRQPSELAAVPIWSPDRPGPLLVDRQGMSDVIGNCRVLAGAQGQC